MAGKPTSGNCLICTQFFSVIHWHHTVPQSRGGKDSLQIPLCSSCHNILHANGVALVARVKGSKKKVRRFWETEDQEKRAQPYLQILVKALLMPIADGYTAKHPIHLSVDTVGYELIKLLQADIGASSIQKTIIHAIYRTLEERGLGNVATAAVRREETQPQPDMWFMHGSRKGTNP